MGITEKYLQLEEELKPFTSIMAKTADAIMDQDISSYPIFITSQLAIDMGIPLITRDAEKKQKWFVNASTLEELNTKNVILSDKIDEFRKIYKDPSLHFCLFVLSDLCAQVIFLPRI